MEPMNSGLCEKLDYREIIIILWGTPHENYYYLVLAKSVGGDYVEYPYPSSCWKKWCSVSLTTSCSSS